MNERTQFWIRRTFLLSFLLLLRPACGGGGGGGGAASAPVPFAVSFTRPTAAPGASRIPVVYVRFNRDFAQATVTATSFTVNDGTSNVAGAFTFFHALNEIRWIPSAPLQASTLHTVTLGITVTDTLAAALPAPYSFTFTTGAQADTTRPTFAGATSAVTPALTTIDLTWTAAADASLPVTYQVFLSLTSGVHDFTSVFKSVVGPATGTTVTGLASNTTFYFVVRAVDTDGNTDLNEIEVTNKTLVSFSTDVYNGIVSPICRNCHTTGEGSTEITTMDYSTAATTYSTWFDITPMYPAAGGLGGCATAPPAGVKRVKSGGGVTAVNDSYLYNKVNSKHLGVPTWCGVGMPKTGGALSQAQVDTIHDWIFQGAPNN